MPHLDPTEMGRQVSRLFQACGVPTDDADLVASDLVQTEVMGVSSHGLIRVMEYLHDLSSGRAVAGAPVTVTGGEGSTLVVNGGWNLGIVTAHTALNVGIEAARQHRIAAVITRECNHVNRLGSYAEAAAQMGFICIAAAALPPLGHFVVPWGGADGRLGTNPFAYGFPTAGDPIVADFATSVIPEGKVRLAHVNGQPLPAGAVLDADGNPTTDASDFYKTPGGWLLPFGGPVGYKGYALGLLVELLGGVLADTPVDDDNRHINGVFFMFLDPTAFLPPGRCEELSQRVVEYMHSSRAAPGHSQVFIPGEIEHMAASRGSLHVESGVWDQIRAVGEAHGVDFASALIDALA